MERLFLIVRIAGEAVAIGADAVCSVVEIDGITPVPRAPPHVAGLFALRSRVLTVIDCRCALGLAPGPRASGAPAAIIDAEGHGYALLVDEIVDVIAAPPPVACAALLEGGWARITIGQIAGTMGTLLLIDPAGLIAAPEAAAA